VIIDARILEVRLDDNYNLGIDWNWVSQRMAFEHPASLEFLGRSDVAGLGRDDNVVLKLGGKIGDDTVNAAIEAMRTFGGVKIVANPHVRAKHGQAALFTSGTSQRYVSEIERDEDEEGNITTTTTTATVFDGVMLGVVPFIADDGSIDMQIYPIKSEVDPASLALQQITADGARITLPVVDVKNVSTSVRVKNGETIILGGLIDKETSKIDNGVPGLMSLPGVGWLFKSRASIEAVRELVIIMTIRNVQ